MLSNLVEILWGCWHASPHSGFCMTNPPGSDSEGSITWFLTTACLFIPSFLQPPLLFAGFDCYNASLFLSIILLPSVSYSIPSSTILPSSPQLLITLCSCQFYTSLPFLDSVTIVFFPQPRASILAHVCNFFFSRCFMSLNHSHHVLNIASYLYMFLSSWHLLYALRLFFTLLHPGCLCVQYVLKKKRFQR